MTWLSYRNARVKMWAAWADGYLPRDTSARDTKREQTFVVELFRELDSLLGTEERKNLDIYLGRYDIEDPSNPPIASELWRNFAGDYRQLIVIIPSTGTTHPTSQQLKSAVRRSGMYLLRGGAQNYKNYNAFKGACTDLLHRITDTYLPRDFRIRSYLYEHMISAKRLQRVSSE